MATEQGTTRDTTAQRLIRQVAAAPTAILRSLVLGAVVFTLAALTGALLSGAAAPPETDSAPPAASAAPDRPAAPAPGAGEAKPTSPPHAAAARLRADPGFARSMVYSGAAALAVSVVGLVVVTRRRRLW